MLLAVIGCEAPATLSSAAFLLETVRIVETAPYEHLHLRLPAFEHENARPILTTAQQEALALRDAEASLGKEFDLTSLVGTHDPSRLLQNAAVLDEASWWSRMFGSEYREAVKVHGHIARGRKTSRRQMSVALRTVAEYGQKRAQFDHHTGYREILGVHFQGVSSPWKDLDGILLWYEQVFVALPDHQAHSAPFRQLVFTARAERLKAMNANLTSTEEHREALQQIVSRVAEFTHAVPSQRALMVSGSFEEILACLQKLVRELGKALRSVERAAIGDNVVLRDLGNILAAAGQCRSAISAVKDAADLPALIGAAYRGVNTDVEPIKNTVRFAESVASGNLPQKTAEWLLCPECGSRLAEFRTWLGGARDCAARFHAIAEDLATLSGAEFWNVNADNPWGSLQALAEFALQNREELTRWNHFLRVRIQSRENGLEKLTALAEARTLEPQELVPAFHFVVLQHAGAQRFTDHAELSQVTGVTQEQLQRQFAEADREAIRLYSERVAAIIDQRPVPYGNQSGPVRTWTEMALITNEINKQKRHIPIRQLIQRSANALVALKPCFMMGPLSVAQYLAPGQLKFDLVVMDEASQLKPEDAIGALARGGQIVIVGDPKQLPPTSFFQRVSSMTRMTERKTTRTAVEEGESILDVASTLVSARAAAALALPITPSQPHRIFQ